MKAENEMVKVEDHMTRSLLTITSEDSLQTAMDILCKRNVRELPVVEHGRLIGIVTDRDLKQVMPSYPVFREQEEIDHYSRNLKVAAAMTPDPMVVSPKATLVEAAEMLRTYRVNSLPVVEGGKLVGLISVSDILNAFIQQNKQGAKGRSSGRSA